jgi:hypothetical protein
MNLILLQTSSGEHYVDMMSATNDLHKKFCEFNDVEIYKFYGIKRGIYHWQATFNRIIILNEMLNRYDSGWIIYLDADAVIVDVRFPIREYLKFRDSWGMIAAHGGFQGKWDINAGIIFFNISNQITRETIREWHKRFYAVVSDSLLFETREPWGCLPNGEAFPDDQALLHAILIEQPEKADAILMESDEIINYESAKFVRQILRSSGVSEVERVAKIKSLANSVQI